MKRLAQRSVFAWVIALAASSALAQFTEMTSRVPESANMISLINVEQVLASPMAVKEGWDQDPVKRFAAGLTNIPSGSNQLLFATQMDIELTRPVWELGMIQLDEAPSATELAEKHGGTTDSVAGFPAVRLSDDTFRTLVPPPDDSARGNCGTHASPQPGDGPVSRVGHADRSADRCSHRRNPPIDGKEIPGGDVSLPRRGVVSGY